MNDVTYVQRFRRVFAMALAMVAALPVTTANAQEQPQSVCGQGLIECAEDAVPNPCALVAGAPLCIQRPVTNSLIDDEGNVATAPIVPYEYAAAGLPVITEVAGPLLAYADVDAGPLTTDAAIAGERGNPGTAQRPISTGSCDLSAGQARGRHEERHRKGDPSYFYASSAGANCSGSISAHCHTELWRERDGAHLASDSRTDNIDFGHCIANAFHGYYVRPAQHYSKVAIVLSIRGDGYWGSGRGPEGWTCSGQGGKNLNCRRNLPVES